MIVTDMQPRTKSLERICRMVPPGVHHVSLVEAVSTILPDYTFRYRTTRSDWHRIGGVVDANFNRIAMNLRQWAEDECDHDVFALYEKFGAEGYFTTRFDGQTHYFVAPNGDGAAGFVQLEVEELTEVVDHPLFIDDQVPDDIEDLLDPVGAFAARVEARPLGASKYDFRSITDIGDLVSRQVSSEGSDLRYIRFLEEWDKSSAASKGRFCDHFVLKLLSFMDRFGEHKIEATPLPIKSLPVPGPSVLALSGSELSNYLHDYDRKAGFPMAWYFAMLTEKKIWPQIATTVYSDHRDDYRYLPEKDLAVLEHWIRYPYSF
nr:hypothetical protein [uncultured Cohaesibacter sp.]